MRLMKESTSFFHPLPHSVTAHAEDTGKIALTTDTVRLTVWMPTEF